MEEKTRKTLDEYMLMHYKMEIIEDPAEGGFVVSFPALPGYLTCGDTIGDAFSAAKDAQRAWFTAMMEAGAEIPMSDSAGEYSGQFKLRLPESLHKALTEHSKKEGVSMNQYCVYFLSKMDSVYVR